MIMIDMIISKPTNLATAVYAGEDTWMYCPRMTEGLADRNSVQAAYSFGVDLSRIDMSVARLIATPELPCTSLTMAAAGLT